MGDAVGFLAAFLAENVLSTQKVSIAGCHGTRLPFKQLKRPKQEDCLCLQVQHVWRRETLSLQPKAQVFLGISEEIVALVKRHDCRASSCNHYNVQFPQRMEHPSHKCVCRDVARFQLEMEERAQPDLRP